MKELRTGRCRPCDVFWRWEPGKGRRLKDAFCGRCGRRLKQTTFALCMAPTVADGEPIFRPGAIAQLRRLAIDRTVTTVDRWGHARVVGGEHRGEEVDDRASCAICGDPVDVDEYENTGGRHVTCPA